MKRYKYVCEKCGNDEIDFNASGWWNFDEQRHEWDWDHSYCWHCGDECNVVLKFMPQIPRETIVI